MHTDLQYNLITLDTDHESISNESSSQSCLSTTSSSDPLISNLTQTLNDLNFSNISLDKIVDEVFNSLVDHIAFGICFDTLREKTTTTPMVALKIPQPFANQVQKTGPQHKKNKKKMFDNSSLDIFGNSLNGVRKLECVCPNCERSLAASRLAPHLEKCMGMGRNSSRLASKRIAHFIKNSNGASSE